VPIPGGRVLGVPPQRLWKREVSPKKRNVEGFTGGTFIEDLGIQCYSTGWERGFDHKHGLQVVQA
jgi:hypothetical protein